MELSKDTVKVEWVELGEGLSGDFDPNDPDDVELLRFDVSRLVSGHWVEVRDASYCTEMPVSAHPFWQWAGLEAILREVWEPLKEGHSIKRKCEELSWLEQGHELAVAVLNDGVQAAWPPLDRPLTIADFEALERGQVVRLWYSCTNDGDFLWEHDHVDNGRVFGRFIYQEMEQWSTLDDFLYEFAGSVCRGSGAEPVWNHKPPKFRGC
ncbi:MAG: hypothetical protein FOGNACKC_00861 [Anaerolineae bacterium]|nr:hypothetical protein [Anaerolineae bacterium]